MRPPKYCLCLTDEGYSLMFQALVELKNRLIREGGYTDAIIVSKSIEDFGIHNTNSGRKLLRIPAFAFLYLLGHAEKNGYRGIE